MRFLTLTNLVNLLRCERHRIDYALRRHGIPPTAMVGHTRVWSEDLLPQIRRAVEETAADAGRKCKGGVA